MRKCYKFVFLVVIFSVFLISKTYAAEVESCESIQNRDACNSSTENGVSCTWYEDGSANGCAKADVLANNRANSCIDFNNENDCNLGLGENGSRYGCAWNDKYNFCSPNGLAYLACGEGDTDAHDIPQFLPRITSYAIAILKTVTPVILIIMSMVQIIKAIASQNEDEMKKAKSALVKKLIAATLIFFVTTIVQFVIKKAADGSEFASVNNCLSCFINNDCNGSLYFVDGYGNCYDVDSKSQVDCDTDIGVKPRGWVEAADDSGNSSNNNSNSNNNSEENICKNINGENECHNKKGWEDIGCEVKGNYVDCGSGGSASFDDGGGGSASFDDASSSGGSSHGGGDFGGDSSNNSSSGGSSHGGGDF